MGLTGRREGALLIPTSVSISNFRCDVIVLAVLMKLLLQIKAPNEVSKRQQVSFPTAPEVSGTFQPVNSCQFGERERDHRVSRSYWREASKPKRSICRLLWESSGTTSTYALIWYPLTGKYRVCCGSISIKYEIYCYCFISVGLVEF